MAKKKPLVKGGDYTKADLEHAAEDTRMLIANSDILKTCITVDIISRRLYMVMRSVMEHHVRNDWDVTNEDLVLQTLVMSAQEKANDKFSMLSLQQELFQVAIPFMDILVRQEADGAMPPPPDAERSVFDPVPPDEATPTESTESKDDGNQD